MMLFVPAAAHAEKRCGWLDNPATATWSLDDAAGGWIIMENGSGYKAKGMDRIPDLTSGEYVYTHAVHGYACACMEVDTDGEGGSAAFVPCDNCRFPDAGAIPPSAGSSIRISDDAAGGCPSLRAVL